MKTNLFQQFINKLAAALVIFWLSGLILVFCCENLSATEQKESCPLAKSSHCAKSSSEKKSSSQLSVTKDFQTYGCCLLPNIFDKARKVESHSQADVDETFALEIPAAKFSALGTKAVASIPYHPALISKSRTYLKNRVLRI